MCIEDACAVLLFRVAVSLSLRVFTWSGRAFSPLHFQKNKCAELLHTSTGCLHISTKDYDTIEEVNVNGFAGLEIHAML